MQQSISASRDNVVSIVPRRLCCGLVDRGIEVRFPARIDFYSLQNIPTGSGTDATSFER
jgi:hypothetical protein